MSVPANPTPPSDPPLAEPGKRPAGSDAGGVAATAQAGGAISAQRPSQRGESPAASRVTGAIGASANRKDDEDEDEWRHEPAAPVDEPNPLRSLGKAVADTVTGSGGDTPVRPKR